MHEQSEIPHNKSESYISNTIVSKSFLSATVPSRSHLCKDHGEPLAYFCFDCQDNCICSECIVSGPHRNHEVLHLKKAYPLVVDKIEDLVYKLGDRVGEIKDYQTEVENKKQILVNNTARVKSDMASVFADLRQQLDKKEKQLMEKADQFLKENLNEFETYLRSAQSKVIALSKLIDSVNSNYIRKDEVNLVNFYSDNNKKIRYLAEEKIEEVPDLNSILSLDVAINKDSLEEMLDNFRGITVELAAQKGIEVNKIQKPLMATMNRERYGIKKEGTTYIDDFNR